MTGDPVVLAQPQPPFVEIASKVGLQFTHFNGMSGEFYFPENVGVGAALFDFDNDGDLDVYLRQGAMLGEGKTLNDALFPPPPGDSLGDRLFRNDWYLNGDGGRVLRFVDITSRSGIVVNSYGMGVAVGDYDNDGWIDLYLTNLEANQLLHNNGDGTFEETSQVAGVDIELWSVSASFLDYDRDGWLDLYVGNYVDFSLENHKPCFAESSARDYCGPRSYRPSPDRLFRNRGDGTFEDVSAVSGIAQEFGGTLGVVTLDFNLDGWLDIYVANDQLPNQLWMNQQDGHFQNEAVIAGVAVNESGAPEASMGVDAADFDDDGDEDIFVTHLRRQTNTIYVNQGEGWFSDKTLVAGLAAPSLAYTSFGTGWIDFDNDSRLDLLIVNGAVQRIEALALQNDPYPLHQTNQIFRNIGDGSFREVSQEAGAAFQMSDVSRGAAFGDLDNDGDTDVVICNNNGPVRLLRNTAADTSSWLGLHLDASGKSGLGLLGSRVLIHREGRRPMWRRPRVDGSYASANSPEILVGLNGATQISDLTVMWTDGTSEVWSDLPLQKIITLIQSTEVDHGAGG